MYVPKSSILLGGTGELNISSVACGFSSDKIDYYDYQKSLISRINEVYVFFNFIEKNITYLKPFVLQQSQC